MRASVIQKRREDTLLGRRVLTRKHFLLARLLYHAVEHLLTNPLDCSAVASFTLKLTPL